MGVALGQARCRAWPEPSRLALTHPPPGTTPAPPHPLHRDCRFMAAGHAGLRAACPSVPRILGGLPAKASRAFRIFASRKLRCPQCPQKEGLLRRQEECTIWPCRGKRIFQYLKENREGSRSRARSACFLLTLPYPHPFPLQPSPPTLIPCRLTGSRAQLPACSVAGLPVGLGAGGNRGSSTVP